MSVLYLIKLLAVSTLLGIRMLADVIFCNSAEFLTDEEDIAVRDPIFSPDGSKLVYLQCTSGGPHKKCFQLKLVSLAAIFCIYVNSNVT